jgi:hypothetical protein
MRMRSRMLVFAPIYVFGGLSLVAALSSFVSMETASVAILLWFLFFGAIQFLVFRCPHCSKVAVITPRGWATLFVGEACRFCGRAY